MHRSRGLAGRGIVVTRPAQQCEALAALIRAAGGRPIVFPVLEILDVADRGPLNALIDRLDEFDLAIFVSPSAVSKAMKLIRARRELPPGLQVAAIGSGSVTALGRFGVTAVVAPSGRSDSEALLELPQLKAVTGKRVVIFRGEGGRELLGDTLTARGAQLAYAECYRRGKPALDPTPLLDAWARNTLDAIVITSSEGLRNLLEMVGESGDARLKKTPVFVPHPRIGETARLLGFAAVVETESGDEALVAGLSRYFNSGKNA